MANELFFQSAVNLSDNEVHLDTGNGLGSTNTAIRRFTNIRRNVGTAITYADSSTLGGSFTINEPGVYSVTYCDFSTAGTLAFGISIDSNVLTTTITSVSYAEGKRAVNAAATNFVGSVSCTLVLAAGNVLRAHTEAVANGNNSNVVFKITKVSSL